MKLLLLFVHDYWLSPHEKNLPDAADVSEPLRASEAVLALIHVEAHDPERASKLTTKAVKHIKWLAGKFNTRTVVLHSFAHLSTTTAEPTQAEAMCARMRQRLLDTGYLVHASPFGYFNEFKMHVAGPSLAKVFVDL